MLVICPVHKVTYNTDTNVKCAICSMHPFSQEIEMRKMKKFKTQEEVEEERYQKRVYNYEAYNKKRRDKRQ